MAVDFIWFGPLVEASSGFRACARLTNGDPVTVSFSNGESRSITPLSANDYIIATEFIGAAGDTIRVTFTQGSSTDSADIRIPDSSDTVKVAWCSCIGQARSRFTSAFEMVDRHDVDAVLIQDDFPYIDNDLIGFGENHFGVGTDPTDISNFWSGHRYIRKIPGSRYLGRRRVYSWMPGDHGFSGEDWDHSIKLAAIPYKSGGCYAYLGNRLPTAAEVVGFWAANNAGASPYYISNPRNNDAGVTAQAPPTADAVGIAANGGVSVLYPPRYHRMRFGTILEIFVLDPFSHCDEIETLPGAGKTMLGTVQKAWLKAALKASPCVFKAISCSAKTFINANDNCHAFEGGISATITTAGQPDHPLTFTSQGYTNERDELLAYIEAGTDWVVPGGVAWLAGDRHCSSVHTSPTYDHVSVVACPESNDVNVSQGTTKPATTLWIDANLRAGVYSGGRNSFGVVEASLTEMILKIVTITGSVIWRGRILPGSNSLSYENSRVSL